MPISLYYKVMRSDKTSMQKQCMLEHGPVISWYTSMPVVVSRYVATVSSGLTSVAFVTMPCVTGQWTGLHLSGSMWPQVGTHSGYA